MATIAELLGAKAAEVKALDLRPDPCVEAMHYVATGLPGSPYKKDAAGRLRRNGRWAKPPVQSVKSPTLEERLLMSIFGANR